MHISYSLQRTLILFTGLLFAYASLSPTSVWAQKRKNGNETRVSQKSQHTPATTVEDNNGDIVLQSNVDGGLLAPGTFGTGALPATGSSTRMMWYPAKAAFRAGRVSWSDTFNEWDENAGVYSVAFGFESAARGQASVAMGQEAFASTDFSATFGVCNDANNTADGSLFVVGNGTLQTGTTCNTFSDALVLDKGGDLTISGTLVENSDRRLKTNIEPLGSETLEKLGRLRPVRFEFKNQKTHPSGQQIGLIAQDVQAQFPELVRQGEDGYLSLSYTRFSTVLLKGLQEQQARLEEKEEQIADLKAENEAIKNQQKKLKKRLAKLETRVESGSILAGWTGSGFLALLLALGTGLGAGLLWRGRGDAR